MTHFGLQNHGDHHPMRLLAAGVPLTLLLDLATPEGPDSEHIAAVEGGPVMSGIVAAQ